MCFSNKANDKKNGDDGEYTKVFHVAKRMETVTAAEGRKGERGGDASMCMLFVIEQRVCVYVR